MELLVGNPVHVYTLLDRLVRGLPGLLAGVSSQLGDSINLVTGHLAQLGLGDVEAAGQALVRIQFAYRCPVSAPPVLTSCWLQAGPGGPGPRPHLRGADPGQAHQPPDGGHRPEQVRGPARGGVASSVITQVQRAAAPAAQPRARVRGCDRVGGGGAAAGRGRGGEAVRAARPGHGQARAQPALGGQPRSRSPQLRYTVCRSNPHEETTPMKSSLPER